MVDAHAASIPIIYGGKIGVGVKVNKFICDLDYFTFPSMDLLSYKKVSISVSRMFKSRNLKRSFIYGFTYMRIWDVEGSGLIRGQIFGFNGNQFYPYIGYYNQRLAKSIFCLSVKLGMSPLLLNEPPNKIKFNGVFPLIDLTLGIRLYKK